MEKFKRILSVIPGYYLIAIVLGTWYPMRDPLNPVFIGLLLILVAQLFLKNKIAGLLIWLLFLVVNLFMFLALLSEFSEFPVVNARALQLIIVGSCIIALHITISVVMIRRNLKSFEAIVHQ